MPSLKMVQSRQCLACALQKLQAEEQQHVPAVPAVFNIVCMYRETMAAGGTAKQLMQHQQCCAEC